MRWDVFCAVIDNFGDIGACWRLARQLAAEHGLTVRLWVDDLASFARLCPQLDAQASVQAIGGVQVCHWGSEFPADVIPADVVVEAFACELPASYVASMAAGADKPVWINLEYLSAEPWVAEYHGMASPHPRLPLVKYFFFPGFAPDTGGLLRERDLLARRDAFGASDAAQQALWRETGFAQPAPEALAVSLFGYRNAAADTLLRVFADCDRPIVCAVCEGPLLQQAGAFFGRRDMKAGEQVERGGLTLRALPFVSQDRYDALLWACDINFVRGEDSFVRAQWAARPMIWHIYPQAGNAHSAKLEAFLTRYCAGLDAAAAAALCSLWRAWNLGEDVSAAWRAFLASLASFEIHAQGWARGLAVQTDLATRLAEFCANRLK